MRRWLSPPRGVSKDKLTQYLRALQLRRDLFVYRDETLSNTLFQPLSEINNVLHMSVDGTTTCISTANTHNRRSQFAGPAN